MSVSISSTCAATVNALIAETGRFQDGIFRGVAWKHPIVRLQSKTRGQWQPGMGASQNSINFERSFPNLETDGWVDVSETNGLADGCLPPSETVTFGQTSRPFEPKHYSINTDYFCIGEIDSDWKYEQMLGNITKALGGISEWVWYQRMTRDYVANVGNYLTLRTDGIHSSSSGYDVSNPPNAPITQGVLNDIYMDLVRESDGKGSGIDEGTGELAFSLITDPENSRRITHSSTTSGSGARDDQRYAYMGKGEMTPLLPGMPTKKRNYGGYVHEIEYWPRRFNLTGGAYVEVPSHVRTATTKGYKWEYNNAYKYAAYTELIVWHEDLGQSLTKPTAGNIAPNWDFKPQTWMGNFTPRNIEHATCNPDGTRIFMRALFSEAFKPLNPRVGYGILVANCGVPLELSEGCYV